MIRRAVGQLVNGERFGLGDVGKISKMNCFKKTPRFYHLKQCGFLVYGRINHPPVPWGRFTNSALKICDEN